MYSRAQEHSFVTFVLCHCMYWQEMALGVFYLKYHNGALIGLLRHLVNSYLEVLVASGKPREV